MSVLGKVVASLVVVVLAIPGLIIEPGPLSELAALTVLIGIWAEGQSATEALEDAA